MTVLVGTAASGKTTVRRLVLDAGMEAEQVVSLDDLRREVRAADAAGGRPVRALQDYSLAAVRRAARRCDALAAFGVGYLADATNLRRRERRTHVRTAADTGLPARAILMPYVPLDTLVERDAARPADDRVPVDVLARQAHRRSLLSAPMLSAEGFCEVLEL